MQAASDVSSVAQADSRMPLEQELRCGLGALRPRFFDSRPVAILGLTAASSAALVAELVVRFTWPVERDMES